jgi:O-antigen ligase
MRLSNFSSWSEQAARASAIALGFSIPISVAVDNVLLGLVLLFWLASAGYPRKLSIIRQNRVALAALALFALLVIGLAYGTRLPGDGLTYLNKYSDLAFVPIFATLFALARTRRLAWMALAASLALTLVLSWLAWGGLLTGDWMTGLPGDNTPFKRYLTQSILLAFGACLFSYLCTTAQSRAARYAWFALAVLAIVNVLLVLKGRTGQVILAVLAVHAVYARWRLRGAVVMLLAVIAVATGLALSHTTSGDRIVMGLRELQQWQPSEANTTAVGERLEFYHNSLEIAERRPWFGTGTGSFPKVYADQVAGTSMVRTVNPHDEYIHLTVQLGVVGLVFLLYLFYCEWRTAAKLATSQERDLARALVITFVVGCLFNSLLLDHVEGLLFAWASGLAFAALGAKTGEPAP